MSEPGSVRLVSPPGEGQRELELLAHLAWRDGSLADAERRLLLAHAVGVGLTPNQARRALARRPKRPLDSPGPLPDPRRVFGALLDLAACDGDFSANERAFVERIGLGLGLPAAEVRGAVGAGVREQEQRRLEESRGPRPGPPPRPTELAWQAFSRRELRPQVALAAALAGTLLVFLLPLHLSRVPVLVPMLLGPTLVLGVCLALLRRRWSSLRELCVHGEVAPGKVRRLAPVTQGRSRVQVGWRAHYTWRTGERHGADAQVVRLHTSLEEGQGAWVLLDPRDPSRSVLEPRHW